MCRIWSTQVNKYLKLAVILLGIVIGLAKLTYQVGQVAGRYYYANRHIIDPAIKSAATTSLKVALAATLKIRAIATSDNTKAIAHWLGWQARNFVIDQLGDLAPKTSRFVAYTADEIESVSQEFTIANLKDRYANFFDARIALNFPNVRSWKELAAAVR
ncbi:hypothetical protein [Synechococcus elongatus]|uniref:hypothetical protein n=1 Tax=Synechococcus elongatus TaxID=32046 RepID=UPI000F7E5408|nr:hypothetical protein [Synechococcus elongatus]